MAPFKGTGAVPGALDYLSFSSALYGQSELWAPASNNIVTNTLQNYKIETMYKNSLKKREREKKNEYKYIKWRKKKRKKAKSIVSYSWCDWKFLLWSIFVALESLSLPCLLFIVYDYQVSKLILYMFCKILLWFHSWPCPIAISAFVAVSCKQTDLGNDFFFIFHLPFSSFLVDCFAVHFSLVCQRFLKEPVGENVSD